MAEQDAAFAVLTEDGQLDTAYGDGMHVLPFGTGSNDSLWAGAVSGTNVLMVGFKGYPGVQTDVLNDDAYAVVLPLR